MTLVTTLLSHTTTITDLAFGFRAFQGGRRRLMLFSTSNDLTLKV